MRLRKSTGVRKNQEIGCVVITGASSGIGEATLRHFARRGFKTIGVARRGELLRKISDELNQNGPQCSWYECNLSDQLATVKVAERILAEHGCPDGVIFNAGFSASKLFDKNLPSDRSDEITLNYLSPTWMLDVFLPRAKERGRGHFIAVGSLAASTSFPGNATYAASKAALAALWQSLEHEYVRDGLTFSTVLPGLIETEMSRDMNIWLPRRSAQSVAELIFETLHKPGMAKTNGLENQAILAMTRLFPETTQTVVTQIQTLLTPRKGKS
ncbi:MAG: hypothetical protein RL189_1301 [Pseudomonadota bacterium]|jgi:short-subunit dehydrogenase